METRSKAQREATGLDSGKITTGQALLRSAYDPSFPILTPVGFPTTPVRSDDTVDDAAQHQEPSNITSESGNLTLEPPVRIDPVESVMVRPVASCPLVSLDIQSRSLSGYSNVANVSLPAAASAVSTDSWDSGPKGDADEEVASYMTIKSPVAFHPPPSRASRRSVSLQSRQSVHSVPGDPLVELMSRMVENSTHVVENNQQEALWHELEMQKREQEAREDARRREQEMEKWEQEAREEAREEACRREQAFELWEKEIRRQNEQREYDLRQQCQVEMESRYLHEKLAAAEKEKEKELLALHEKQEVEKLALLEKQEAEKLILEKMLELEKQKNVQIAGQLVPGNPRVVAETGCRNRK